ncbi:MAG: hypothetical protein Q9183_003043 [Haloplaca sp. 2 TL-2023]
MGVSTLCFVLGTTLPVLLAARIFEGLSTAIASTLGMALLTDVVGSKHIGRSLGYTTTALTLGLLLGPPLGGVLYEYGGYFQVFLPAFALLVVELVLRLLVVEPKAPRQQSTPPQGSSASGRPTAEQRPADPGVSDQDRSKHLRHGSQDPEREPLVAKAEDQVSQNAYVVLLCSPQFVVASLGLFVMNGIGCSFDGVLAPYIKDVLDLKATHAAVLFLVLAIPMFILGPVSGALADRCGAKWVIASGFLIVTPAVILLRIVDENATRPLLKLIVLLFFVGSGAALSLTPLRTEAIRVVDLVERENPGIFGPRGAYTRAHALMNTAIAAGSLVGPLYAGFVRIWLGWGSMSLSFGIFSSIVLVLVVMVAGGESPKTKEAQASTSV